MRMTLAHAILVRYLLTFIYHLVFICGLRLVEFMEYNNVYMMEKWCEKIELREYVYLKHSCIKSFPYCTQIDMVP